MTRYDDFCYSTKSRKINIYSENLKPVKEWKKGTRVVGALAFSDRQDDRLYQVCVGPHGSRSEEASDCERFKWDCDELHALEFCDGPGLTKEKYIDAVEQALKVMPKQLRKVVLARSKSAEANYLPLQPSILSKLKLANPEACVFSVPVDEESCFLGASPEQLVAKTGSMISCHPLAGSAARDLVDPEADKQIAQDLLLSHKDRIEHSYVVSMIEEKLRPLCHKLKIGSAEIVSTDLMWHIGTKIEAELKEPDAFSALDLARLLHPTSAVAGTPTGAAQKLIQQLEPVSRGLYAGTVGYCDENGDGEWYVAIRCATLSGAVVTAWAGAGIVPGSDPYREYCETESKLKTFLSAVSDDKSALFPSDVTGHYRQLGLWVGQKLDQMHTVHSSPEAIALIDASEKLTYYELEQEVSGVAAAMAQAGVKSREHVLVHLPNTVSVIIGSLALLRLGAIPIYLLSSHGLADVKSVAKDAKASVYMSVQPWLEETTSQSYGFRKCLDIAQLRHQAKGVTNMAKGVRSNNVKPQDLAFLQLSGGTTGKPKLIPRTHDDYAYSIRRSVEVCGYNDQTCLLIVLPATHNFPTSSPGYMGALYAGGTVVLSEKADSETAFSLIEEHQITHVPLVPALAKSWAEAAKTTKHDLTSIQTIQVGGAKLVPEAARKLYEAGSWQVQQVFGMAEGLVCYTRMDDNLDQVLNTQGVPMSEYDECRIVDPISGEVVSVGRSGMLQVRGPYTIRGYWNAPTVNRRSFTDDGYYITGDIACQLPSGHLVVKGREKDHINRAGEKVSAEEVEDLILSHPAIYDVVVVGIPDRYLGERVCAVVVLNKDATSIKDTTFRRPDLYRYLKSNGVARFKIPDVVRVVDRFPVTKVGKINRIEVRKLLADIAHTE